MKIKYLIVAAFIMMVSSAYAQQKIQAAVITLKDGTSYDVHHFGQLQCGKDVYSKDYIITRGKFMDAVTEIKDYKDIEKIVLEGYTKPPVATIGNEKGTLRVLMKNGNTVTLDDAELTMSCYAAGDKYNELIVQIMNPLTNKPSEQPIPTMDIQSIVFK